MQAIFIATLEIWGALFCFFMIICVLIQEQIDKREQKEFVTLLFCTMSVLASDSIAYLFRGREGLQVFYIVAISNFCGFLFTNLLCVDFQIYILHQVSLPKWMRTIAKVSVILVIPSITLLVISQFTGWYYSIDSANMYRRGDWFWVSQVYGVLALLIVFVMLLMTRKQLSNQKFLALMSYIVLPMIGLLIQITVYGFSLLNIASLIAIMWIFLVRLIEINKALLFRDRVAAEKQTKIIFSQIQPYFLYNVLNSIYYLCDKEPLRAKDAIGDFADYLRGNLKYINQSDLVTFESELEHTKKYLELEKIRFGEKLKYEYHIMASDFRVPPLSIQPIVENAVKHGIRKKKDGGTIIITSREEKNKYIVTVEDTGIGFRSRQPENKDSQRIGIQNVMQRMKMMCGGVLEIKSKKNQGTIATFTFFK